MAGTEAEMRASLLGSAITNTAPKTTTTTAPKTTTPPTSYIDAIRQESIRQSDDTGAQYLSQYGIPAAMWQMWAAAAGLPGARYTDPVAARKVASWAAETLLNEFEGNWGLVAIGWRYGMGTARQIQNIYGGTPAKAIIERFMGKAGAAFVGEVISRMARISAPDPTPPPFPYFPVGTRSGGGNVELKFKMEEAEEGEFEETEYQGPNPAHVALQGVLAAMADRVAGGKRLSIEEVESQVIPVEMTTSAPSNISAEDTEHMNG